jgi:peptidoglycan/LPS O-acetylase OafA/YrhL
MKLADRVGSRQNNFDALRLIAAVMVLVSHCFPLTGHPEPLASISQESFGELGVSIFFAISGFLIAGSWSHDPALPRFALKRGLRLMPGLWVAVLVTALVIGPAVTTLSVSGYFTDIGVYRYIVQNSVLYTVNGHLPGVFAGNVYPNAVNGSLWTLPVEAFAYLGVVVLGVLGALQGRATVIPLLSFLVLLVLSMPFVGLNSVSVAGPVSGHIGLILYLSALFNLGVLMYVWRERVPLRWDIAAVLLIAWIAVSQGDWMHPVALLAIPYLVLMLAYRTPHSLSVITRPGDLSYGIYVYAFPAQQVAGYAFGPKLGPGGMLAVVAAPVYLVALASWRLIEAPALRRKPRAAARPQPRPAVARSGEPEPAYLGTAPSSAGTGFRTEPRRRG